LAALEEFRACLAGMPHTAQNIDMPRRKRYPWPLLIAVLAVVVLLLLYVVGWPLAASLTAPAREGARRPHVFLVPIGEQIPIRLFEFLIFAWLFVFGSCIGSFLNVVIYRVPRGMSLWGSSHCPSCCVRIPARDNVPVFGWLALRGRCRTCRLPISPRYPLVELAVGLVVLILSMLEILFAGLNLPGPGERTFAGLSVSWLVSHPRWDLIGTCALHSGLVCVLLSWALIRHDGYAVPRGYTALAFAAGLLWTVWTPVQGGSPWPLSDGNGQAWTQIGLSGGRALAGLGGGLLLGLIAGAGARLAGRDAASWRPQPEHPPPDRAWAGLSDALAGLGLVGVCLGWSAAASIGLLAAAARFLRALALGVAPTRRAAPLLASVCLATFLQICLWRWLDGLPFWPNDSAGPVSFAAAATIVLVLTWQAAVLERLGARAAAAAERPAGSPLPADSVGTSVRQDRQGE